MNVKKMLVRIVIAAVLLVLAVGFRRAAAIEDRLASTQEQLMTQTATVTPAAYDEVEDALAFATRIPLVGRSLLDEVRVQRAQAAYWNGDYAAVASLAAGPPAPAAVEAENEDPDLMFLAANASYRRTIQSGAERPVMLRALDDVLKRYGDVLDADPEYTGAAYNYEFVGRLRTALARGRPSDAIASERPNMHGDEGNPPQGTKPPEFNVIVPMRPDERQEQFDAGVGGVTRRRG
ncbi:MAG TPA: hypothetical protein VIX63_11985 [Vicinamibacterales bacterium]